MNDARHELAVALAAEVAFTEMVGLKAETTQRFRGLLRDLLMYEQQLMVAQVAVGREDDEASKAALEQLWALEQDLLGQASEIVRLNQPSLVGDDNDD